ncbi:MAG: diversity-generating retroelement protein Avd [Candidatus Omnitrophica bacterium]|nr:diversity-generating retroelement protein Avd [Candidatus Omnitrophota bacterium]
MLADLKIFAKVYDSILYLHREIAGFPKSEKPVLGKRIYDSLLQVLSYIITANEEIDKNPPLKSASIELEKLRIFIRLSFDLHLINIKKYAFACQKIDEIGRMLGGWIKASIQNSGR